ncbi:MAG: aldo/keto reductase [Leptospiraceae bacterium]|nr:aldo/keto reductase [Leptospiraceae bacterium]
MRTELFQPFSVGGYASAEGTSEYFRRLQSTYGDWLLESWFRHIPAIDCLASRLGFGSYRVKRTHRQHFDALREALISGTNVIDTAAHFTDGESESLIGDVLSELFKANRIKREEIILISKCGYIQGSTLTEYGGNPPAFPGAVQVYPDLVYSLDSDFIVREVENSRRRLGVDTIDVYLIQNPENYLIYAQAGGMDRAEAQDRLLTKLKNALETLHALIDKNWIRHTGISSNALTLPEEDYCALSIATILEQAPGSFRVIQFPANLLEADYRFSRRTAGGNLMEYLQSKNLWSLSNRPLNARYHGRLLRLARMVDAPPDDGMTTEAEMNRLMGQLMETEAQVLNFFSGFHFGFDERTPSPSLIIRHYRDRMNHAESFQAALPHLRREIQKTMNQLYILAETQPQQFVLESLARRTNAVLSMWEKYIDVRYHQNMETLEAQLCKLPRPGEQPLAVQAVLFLLSASVPQTVLVGMRTVPYVRQLSRVYALPAPPMEAALTMVDTTENSLEQFSTDATDSPPATFSDNSADPA